jgi:hypothetical protein
MITLQAETKTWLNTSEDCPSDLCAHGTIRFSIDGMTVVSPDNEWTISAAAIYLLRTLDNSHTPDAPVCEHLFPCCGFTMYDMDGDDDVFIMGCVNGIDCSVIHRDDSIEITTVSGETRSVSKTEWKKAVLHFSSDVRGFYDASADKTPHDDVERKGFAKMMSEWERRHPRPEAVG